MKTNIQFACASDIGRVRHKNEDRVDAFHLGYPGNNDNAALAVVADGMGGHQSGEIASELTIRQLHKLQHQTQTWDENILVAAVLKANRKILRKARWRSQYRGMGTTCTALLLHGNTAFLAHVGDSRAYLIRDEHMYQLTQDHTAVSSLHRKGVIDYQSSQEHPDRNILTRALGIHKAVEVESWKQGVTVKPGDIYLLCSDGLHGLCDEKDIYSIVTTSSCQNACVHLIDLANKLGGQDNISVAILSVPRV